MEHPIELSIASGAHDRRSSPVFIDLPGLVERPTLFRTGRQRPVPCQTETLAAATRLWWIVESQAAGTTVDHRVMLGQRERLPPPRVTLEKAPVGWTVSMRGAKTAEMHFPEVGVPRVALLQSETSLAAASLHSAPSALEQAPKANRPSVRRRLARPAIASGPVFGRLAAEYHVLGPHDVPLWSEAYDVRFYDGPDDLRLIDLTVSWLATTGPIWLWSPSQSTRSTETSTGLGVLPTLRLDLTALGAAELIALPGWQGPTEIAGRPAPVLVASASQWSVAILCRSTSFGFPPCWTFPAPLLVETSPLLDANRSQVSLGDELVLSFRFAVMRSSDPVAETTRRFLDFDVPPEATFVTQPRSG